jgi:hypothetical protein
VIGIFQIGILPVKVQEAKIGTDNEKIQDYAMQGSDSFSLKPMWVSLKR